MVKVKWMFDNEGVFCWEDEPHSTAFMSAKDVIVFLRNANPEKKMQIIYLIYPSMKVLQ